ncbi:MAG: tetratricopeptide repeat protein, partial [Calditrichia bacterium]
KSLPEFSSYFQQAPELRYSLLQKWVAAWQKCPDSSAGIIPVLGHLLESLSLFDRAGAAAKLLAGVADSLKEKHLMKEFLLQTLQEFPRDAGSHYFLGNLYLENNQYSKAEACYRKALEYEPGVWEVYYNLAVVQIKQQQFKGALQVLDTALGRFPHKKTAVEKLIGGLLIKIRGMDKIQAVRRR